MVAGVGALLQDLCGTDGAQAEDRLEATKSTKFDIPFIMSYSSQHYTIKHIIQKHWHILLNNNVLAQLLPPKPQVVYRGVTSIKNRIVQNVLDLPLSQFGGLF